MKKFIQINSEGLILSVSSPATPDFEPLLGLDPATGLHFKEVLSSYDNTDLLNSYYYDLDSESLKILPTKPTGNYYCWQNKSWVLDSEALLTAIRASRDNKLLVSDWTQIPDSPLTTEQQAAWATYRQELRDITDNLSGDETCVEDAPWPIQP